MTQIQGIIQLAEAGIAIGIATKTLSLVSPKKKKGNKIFPL